MTKSTLVHWLMALPFAAAAFAASAQGAPRSFAVVSEVAREIRVSQERNSHLRMLNNNMEDRLPIPGGALDKVVLVTTKQAIAKIEPAAPVWLVAPLEADLFDAQYVFIEGRKIEIPADLAAALKQRGSTHLVLFTRVRSDAKLQALRTVLGSGKIEGVGFFVDWQTPMENSGTLATTYGFLAPFVYIRATLIDIATGEVLSTQAVTDSTVLSGSRVQNSGNPWAVMSATEKVQVLSDMITGAVDKLVPLVLTAPPPSFNPRPMHPATTN